MLALTLTLAGTMIAPTTDAREVSEASHHHSGPVVEPDPWPCVTDPIIFLLNGEFTLAINPDTAFCAT
jgi:hypothetical protein